MAAPMRISRGFIFCQILAIFFHLTYSLYEDQVGQVDWRQQYIGKVKFAFYDQSTHSGRRILVGTDQNVLAALTARNGRIGWRQILEPKDGGKLDDLVYHSNYLISVSGGGQMVRRWNPSMGSMQWEAPTGVSGQGSAKACIFAAEEVAVLSSRALHVYSVGTGKLKWMKNLPNGDITKYKYLYCSKEELITVGVAPGAHVVIVTYKDGGLLKSQKSVPAAWVQEATRCTIIQGRYFVCIDERTHTLQALSLVDGKAFVTTLLQDLGFMASRPELLELNLAPDYKIDPEFGLRITHSHIAVLKILNGNVKVSKDFPGVSAIQVTKLADKDVLLTLSRKPNDILEMKAYTMSGEVIPDLEQKIAYPVHHGHPEQVFSLLFKKKDGGTGYRILVLSQDQALVLFQQSGKITWTREEALSTIISAEMVDLPLSEIQAKMEEEFSSSGDDVLGMFVKRFTTQFQQLKAFVLQLKHKLKVPKHHHHGEPMEESLDEGEDEEEDFLTRDEFNLHKMMVVATGAGKVFGIDSATGRTVWQHWLPDLVPFQRYGKASMPLLVQRTTAHFPHPPQCLVLGKHRVTGNGLAFSFNPITGEVVPDTAPAGKTFNFQVLQATMISQMTDNFLKPLVMLDTNLKYHVYPEECTGLVSQARNSLFLFTADMKEGVLTGYGMKLYQNQELVGQSMWTVNLHKDTQTVTNVVTKAPTEHVHSQGIVLGDRSVLYKYLNPNLIAVTTEGTDNQGKGFLNVYMVDAVSGHIVFHCTHKKSKGPVHVVHSENWVVYSYWNQKNRRNEMSVLELYEGKKQSNATAFSSLTPPPPPIVMRQSYIFPGHVSHMAVTITEKGITHKHILMALQSGGILELPKGLLDPRRPLVPTQETQEEGIMPYIPELPRPFEAMINYNQSVFNIRGIHTAPAGLESTSLVLAYGLDMFYTRVTPSKMFDVLKEDFDYMFISSVLIGMIVVSVISQKLAARKGLNRAWK